MNNAETRRRFEADPRAVIFCNVFATLVGLFAQNLLIMSVTLICTALLAWLLGANPLRVIVRLRRFLVLFAALILLQSIFVRSGTVWLQICDVVLLTSGGVEGGLAVLLRLGILLMSGAAVASCGIRRGVQAMVQLKISYDIAFMVCIAIHFIPLLADEIRDALVAIQLRGIDFKRISLRRRIRVYAYLFLPVAGGAVLKAQDLAGGIELRGFRAYPKRTSLTILRMRTFDYLIVVLFALGAAAALYLYYGGLI
jgi:energy-coupling factor transport system permease protein